MISQTEREFRKRRWEYLVEAWREADTEWTEEAGERARAPERGNARAIIDQFTRTGDVETFRKELDGWARGKKRFGFSGIAGGGTLNALVNDAEAQEATAVLREVVTVPLTDSEASAKIDRLVELIVALREDGSSVKVGNAAFFASWFWWLREPEKWPCYWYSARAALDTLGWSTPSDLSQAEAYLAFRDQVHDLGPFTQVEEVLAWLVDDEPGIGLAPTAVERMKVVLEGPHEPSEDPAIQARYEENLLSIHVVQADLRRLGAALDDLVAEASGYRLHDTRVPAATITKDGMLRSNPFVRWRLGPEDGPFVGLSVFADPRGVHFGITPFTPGNAKGFTDIAFRAAMDHLPDGYRALATWPSTEGEDMSWETNPGWFFIARTVGVEDVADLKSWRDELRQTIVDLKPAMEAIRAAAVEPPAASRVAGDLDLARLAERFVEERGHAADEAPEDLDARREFAALLDRDVLPALEKEDLRKIYGGHRYGYPGHQANLHKTVRDLDDAGYQLLLASIDVLLWGEEKVADRIDRVLDEDDLGFFGFKDGAIMKLLAVTHPDEFLAVYPLSGDRGKLRMLRRLGLPVPDLKLSQGERQVATTRALSEATAPYFDEPLDRGRFLYWLLEQEEAPAEASEDVVVLDEVADDLLLDVSFLEDVVALLEKQRQVIFYGPPGTGKTYVAQKLAEALVPDAERRQLIQFHPSTSYEDFVEGIRPETSADGQVTYELQEGPLVQMAELARAAPHERQILIIDEINRANLAKALGELLYLLEYRGESARMLYRPGVEFSLPENLWIIGTMNTADRSIALVDAALRRRFQFVPFVPDDREQNPISGLLGRWLERHAPDRVEIADFVDDVNQALRKKLGGTHLLIGPSYFMTDDLSEAGLRRIWRYQIEPLVDDLFFSEPEEAEHFHFEQAWGRFTSAAADDEPAAESEPDQIET